MTNGMNPVDFDLMRMQDSWISWSRIEGIKESSLAASSRSDSVGWWPRLQSCNVHFHIFLALYIQPAGGVQVAMTFHFQCFASAIQSPFQSSGKSTDPRPNPCGVCIRFSWNMSPVIFSGNLCLPRAVWRGMVLFLLKMRCSVHSCSGIT
jgi:hypothetical protein